MADRETKSPLTPEQLSAARALLAELIPNPTHDDWTSPPFLIIDQAIADRLAVEEHDFRVPAHYCPTCERQRTMMATGHIERRYQGRAKDVVVWRVCLCCEWACNSTFGTNRTFVERPPRCDTTNPDLEGDEEPSFDEGD